VSEAQGPRQVSIFAVHIANLLSLNMNTPCHWLSRARTMRTFALALTFFSLAAASAADFYKLKKTATASKELRVHAYTHTDATCWGGDT
jgi:hypothetical protein